MDTPNDPNNSMAIAVVGLSLRFPGARDERRFWQNLSSGIESITLLDSEQRAKAGMPSEPGWVAAAGVLEDAELFDAAFFGFSPGEAERMDPQHRLFLECAWSALESAGQAPRGSPLRAGVYAASTFSTYLLSSLLPRAGRETAGLADGLLSTSGDFLATRVAYELDLSGPALTVQTACSSSLVAVHLAVQALLAGECDLALAGGASVRVPQLTAHRFQEGSILAPDGHCRPFDARAAGTVAGNGVGVVVLKRLADALADGDPIRAVILGTAINNDGGAKSGFGAPSVDGQSAAIRDALSMAGVAPQDISYVEAHGTATPLGDPVEVAALHEVFRGVEPGHIGLGAVKSNIGHLDAAAGVAGLIKLVLALENRLLPPTMHFTSPNPLLELDGGPLYVVSQPTPWQGRAPRRAGVSAFGIGGTNAHAVLEEAPPVPGDEPRRDEELLLLSAKSEAALERMTEELATHLSARREPLADVAHTLQVGRARFPFRRFVTCGKAENAAALLRGSEPARMRTTHDEAEARAVAFLFPGGGAQRVNMGAELLSEPVYREAIDRCAELLRGPLGGDLREVMFAGPERFDVASRELDRPLWLLPAVFASDWAQAELWRSWGVKPEAMLGHSLGEYAAACVAGVFTLEEALTLVTARARLMEGMPPGAMVSVLAPVETLTPLLAPELSVSAINGPATCVIAGPPGAIESFEQSLTARGVEFRRVRIPRAVHSSMLDPYLADFARVVSRVALRSPTLPVVSSLTGRWLEPHEATDPEYWVRHMRETVRFSDALGCLLSSGDRALIEVGPGTILSSLARQHPARTSQPVIASLPGNADRKTSPLNALGEAWQAGVNLDWEGFRAGERRRKVTLPTYSFDRERHWLEPVDSSAGGVHTGAVPPPPPAPRRATPRMGPAAPPRDETERALAGYFQELFRIQDVGIHDDFFALGGDSLLALRLTAWISDRFAVRLALKEVLEAPTVAVLARRLGDASGATPTKTGPSCLVRIQDGTRGTPLFFVHAAGGQSLFYRELARSIDASRPAYGFEAVGLESDTCHTSVEEMAAHYLEALRTVRPAGPYLLVGASFGGSVIFEMARRLTAEGHAVPLCAMLDAPGPGRYPEPLEDDAEVLAYLAGLWVEVPAARLRGLSLDAQLQLILDEARRAGVQAFADLEQGRRWFAVWKNNLEALVRYPAPRWEGEVQFFRAAERLPRMPRFMEQAWTERCSALRVEIVPGNHESMLLPPHAHVLGARLARLLPD
ncbi:acyltransferase domain-containing protein [Pyxidicoccus parkwayensis]|uniref:Acyltransferase domain-containing protein n=1 Tax=Pyxidicoccus parkwayensis TaxID=2813578 RepID=A0ABX7P4L6_9BACT|nr:type I polyketide synthase [Pyxidicoccus parkwaysis]QSQ25382.1 acyltransferase domain-containing protein [Pyxidicoccus parkwaysis]